MNQVGTKTCSDCAEIKTITRMDVMLQELKKEVKELKDDIKVLNQRLAKSMPYSNSFFGGVIATSVVIGMLLLQAAQPIVKLMWGAVAMWFKGRGGA